MRLKRFWAATIFILYSLFGFFGAPKIIQKEILKNITETTGRQATLREVRVNPYILSVALRDFNLLESDGSSLMSFREVYVDYQVSSIVRWAHTFREIRLDSVMVHARILPDGQPCFVDIMERIGEEAAADTTQEPPTVPRLLIGRFLVVGAELRGTNLAAAEPEVAVFVPIDLDLKDFSTLPEKNGLYSMAATGTGGGSWTWEGTLKFDPPSSEGHFSMKGMRLPDIWKVGRQRVAFEITGGEMGWDLDYTFRADGDSVIARLDSVGVEMTNLQLQSAEGGPELLAVDRLAVSGLSLRYPEQKVAVDRVDLAGADLTAWLDEDKILNWLALLPPRPVPADSSAAVQAEMPPWHATLDTLAITDCSFHFEDRSTEPDFAFDVTPIAVTVSNISTEPDALFDLDVNLGLAGLGEFKTTGKISAQPPSADLDVEMRGLPLPVFQPYASPFAKIEIVRGSFGVAGHVTARIGEDPALPDVTFSGGMSSDDLLIHDTIEGERLLAWSHLGVTELTYGPAGVSVAKVKVIEPYAKVTVYKDRTNNLQEVFAPALARQDTTAKTEMPELLVEIAVVEVEKGTSDFADYSLLLPFVAGIASLDGHVSGLSSDGLSRADVDITGTTDPHGKVAVSGQVNPLSGDLYTNIDIHFEDFDMPALTPYSGQYIGREIDKGKLELFLNYQVDDRWVVGKNKFIIDQLELGDDVESEEASGMPVGLAVALLKDSNGRIDLDIPVEGDIDDPGFSIWDAVWDVLKNTLMKLITAPFKLLGGLLGLGGGDDPELEFVDFVPGERELSTDGQEKLLQLSEALAQRPELKLNIPGQVQPDADTAALKEAHLASLVDQRMRLNPDKYKVPVGYQYSPELLRDLHTEILGEAATDTLEAHCQVPELDKEGKPKNSQVLDKGLWLDSLHSELVASQDVDEAELFALGLARSNHIKYVLVNTGQVSSSRIFLLNVDDEAELEDGLVRMTLELTD